MSLEKNTLSKVSKAELHVHLEAAITPIMARKLARNHNITLPETIFKNDEQFACADYNDFMQAYDVVAQVVKSTDDYREITYDYLKRSHAAGCVYTELTVSPGHAAMVGLSYSDMLDGVIQGIDQANKDYGIESRIIIVFVRHQSKTHNPEKLAQEIVNNLHPYVVGVGLAGTESSAPAKRFKKAFEIAKQANLHCTAHAGEELNAKGVWDVLENLPIERIGHGVGSMEDPKLIETLIKKNIALEICITSNIITGCYPNYKEHPFLQIYQAGIPLSINSDDPTFFGTSIEKEYAIAQDIYGLTQNQLSQITKDAIKFCFAQDKLKSKLLSLIN